MGVGGHIAKPNKRNTVHGTESHGISFPMPAVSPLSKEGWEQLKKASEMGVKDEVLANEYGVTRDAIRLRRSREKWLTMERVEQHLAERRERMIDTERYKGALEVVAETLQERAEAYSLNTFNKVSALAKKGLELLPTPDTWKTFQIADTIARRAAGLDRPQTQINVAIGGAFRSPQERCIQLDCTESNADASEE